MSDKKAGPSVVRAAERQTGEVLRLLAALLEHEYLHHASEKVDDVEHESSPVCQRGSL